MGYRKELSIERSCHDAKHIGNHEKANGQVPVPDQVMTGIGIAITGV
jgi:hypothetical protein